LLLTASQFSGPEQFELRSRQLRQAAPWVATAPYFAGIVAGLLKAIPKHD